MVLVDLSAALICFLGSCYPALIGTSTPVGEYRLEQRSTDVSGYGGDLLVFREAETSVFAIHRVITFNPAQQRLQRLQSNKARDRIITDGCINVAPEVYSQLVDCCSNQTLVITNEIRADHDPGSAVGLRDDPAGEQVHPSDL